MQRSLLEALIPSFPQVHEIIVAIRKRHNIDVVLRGDHEMIKTVEAQKTPEEWKEVLQDVEKELRDKFNFFDSEMSPFFQVLITWASNSLNVPGLADMNVGVHDPAIAQMIARVLASTPSTMQFLDQFYTVGARELLDYIKKAQPIEIPSLFFNPIGIFTFLADQDGGKVVIAIAHQLTDQNEMVNEFREKMVEAFEEKPNIQEQYLEEVELLVKKNLGESLKAVVDYYLTNHPDEISYKIGTPEYEAAKGKLINKMKARLWRLQQLINKIVGYKK